MMRRTGSSTTMRSLYHNCALLGIIIFATLMCAVVDAGAKKSDYHRGRWFQGEGTYYGAGGTEGGNCAMRSPRPRWMNGYIPIAINDAQYTGSCGACVLVTGNGKGLGANPIRGPFKGVIIDRCPECKFGDLDLSKNGDGRWHVTWKFIPCDNKRGNIEFQFEGSNQFYRKVQPRNTRSPITKVVVDGVNARRSQDNHWICEKHGGRGFNRVYKIQVWTVLGDYYEAIVNKYHGVAYPLKGGRPMFGPGRIKLPAAPHRPKPVSRPRPPAKCVPKWKVCRGPLNVWRTKNCCGGFWCVPRKFGKYWQHRCVEPPKRYRPKPVARCIKSWGLCRGGRGTWCCDKAQRCLLQSNHLGHKWHQCVRPKKKPVHHKPAAKICVPKWKVCRGPLNVWRTKNCCGGFWCVPRKFGKYWHHRCVAPPRNKQRLPHVAKPQCRGKYARCGDIWKWRHWNGRFYQGKTCCPSGFTCKKASNFWKFKGWRCEPYTRDGL